MSPTPAQAARLQDHYEDPYHRGRCERTTHFAESATVCHSTGEKDVVAVELCVQEDVLQEAWFDGDGCELSQAVASMVMEQIEGQSPCDVAQLDLAGMFQRLDLHVDPASHGCCQLVLDALQQAIASTELDDPQSPTFTGPDLGDEC